MTRKDCIEAREFDYLTAGAHDRDDCHPLTGKEFSLLREFVLENRSEDEDSPLELMRLCSPRGIGEAIQLRNYVGVVKLKNGRQIEILPKIDTAEGSTDGCREVFLRMLRELGTSISFKSLDNARLGSGRVPLFEVFVGMFVDEASNLVHMGLKSSYVELHSVEQFVRGRIDFTCQARSNPAHAERVSVIHDEFMVDRPENRLVKSTLLYLRGASRSDANVRAIRRLLTAFDEVGASQNVDADLARCTNDRTTSMYRELVGWARVFLKHESFTVFRGQSVASALLFPMERVFEDYMGKSLRRRAVTSGRLSSVTLQAQSEWLFDQRRIQLRPDILCDCPCRRRVVLDTKWKRIATVRDISTADMYQMYAYGKRYAPKDKMKQHVVLLYPWHSSVSAGLYRDGRHVSGDGVQVDVFFVNLATMDESMEALLRLIEDPAELEA